MFILDGKQLHVDVPFNHDGISYPSNWLRFSSQADRDAIGITEAPDPVRPDDRFYYVDSNGHGVPKDLDELKKTWSNQVDQIAYSMLQPTDWMVVRKQEVGTDIPANWATYRTSVRSSAASNKTALNGASDFDAFVLIATSLQWPVNPESQI